MHRRSVCATTAPPCWEGAVIEQVLRRVQSHHCTTTGEASVGIAADRGSPPPPGAPARLVSEPCSEAGVSSRRRLTTRVQLLGRQGERMGRLGARRSSSGRVLSCGWRARDRDGGRETSRGRWQRTAVLGAQSKRRVGAVPRVASGSRHPSHCVFFRTKSTWTWSPSCDVGSTQACSTR